MERDISGSKPPPFLYYSRDELKISHRDESVLHKTCTNGIPVNKSNKCNSWKGQGTTKITDSTIKRKFNNSVISHELIFKLTIENGCSSYFAVYLKQSCTLGNRPREQVALNPPSYTTHVVN